MRDIKTYKLRFKMLFIHHSYIYLSLYDLKNNPISSFLPNPTTAIPLRRLLININ